MGLCVSDQRDALSCCWLQRRIERYPSLDELLDLQNADDAGDNATALNEHFVALRTLLALDSQAQPFAARYRAGRLQS